MKQLNLLSLNEPAAIGVSVSIEKKCIGLFLTAVTLAASAFSVTGGISFIGLKVPHIVKSIVELRNQLFVPIVIFIGGWLLLFADTVGRNLVDPDGIPARVMVALIGDPYFVYLLLEKINELVLFQSLSGKVVVFRFPLPLT